MQHTYQCVVWEYLGYYPVKQRYDPNRGSKIEVWIHTMNFGVSLQPYTVLMLKYSRCLALPLFMPLCSNNSAILYPNEKSVWLKTK